MTTPNHRKQRANNSREHILDTYVDLLIRSGERAATLDAVATAAKVSKGGLLYHFSSKKALLEALRRTHPRPCWRGFRGNGAGTRGGKRLLHQFLHAG